MCTIPAPICAHGSLYTCLYAWLVYAHVCAHVYAPHVCIHVCMHVCMHVDTQSALVSAQGRRARKHTCCLPCPCPCPCPCLSARPTLTFFWISAHVPEPCEGAAAWHARTTFGARVGTARCAGGASRRSFGSSDRERALNDSKIPVEWPSIMLFA